MDGNSQAQRFSSPKLSACFGMQEPAHPIKSCNSFTKAMKHSDWLRLHKEGEHICAILRQNGYHCQKQGRRLSWWVSQKGSHPYVLAYLTTPVGQWSVMPNDAHPAREKLISIVQSALDNQGEEVSTEPPPEYDPRPWAIVRLLPDARRYTVAKFFNRQDAHDHLRMLNRFMPAAEFEIVFDAVD